jgi:membrane-associated phospholipid phosphatase
MAAFWPVPVARWFSAVINSLMLAATPIDGSHYLVDILAGVAIAVLSLVAARMLVTRMTVRPAATSDLAPTAAHIASSSQ